MRKVGLFWSALIIYHGHIFLKIFASHGLRMLCDGQRIPKEQQSASVTIDGLTGLGARDVLATY